jgi:hypothetical protein
MSLENRLRESLRQVDEIAAPDLRSSVIGRLPRQAGRSESLERATLLVAALGMSILVVVGAVAGGLRAISSTEPTAFASTHPAGGSFPASASVATAAPSESTPPASVSPTSLPSISPTTRPGLAVATSQPGTIGGDALAIGELGGRRQGEIACLWLVQGDKRTALIWPSGFSGLDAPLRLIGPDGQKLAATGDHVELGVTGQPQGFEPTSDQDPCGLGEVLLVGIVVSVDGRDVYIGEGSLSLAANPADLNPSCATILDPLRLVMADGRLRLRMDDGDHDATWPAGFHAVPGNRIKIVDDHGQTVIVQGEIVEDARGTISGQQIAICGIGDKTYP